MTFDASGSIRYDGRSVLYTMHQPMRALVFRSLCLLVVACSRETVVEPQPTVAQLVAITPTSVTGIVGKQVLPAPRVRALDVAGRPVAQAPVVFLEYPGGPVSRTTVRTDAEGTASIPQWILGTLAGQQKLIARSGGSEVAFTAIAEPGPFEKLAQIDGVYRFASPGTTLHALRVIAVDMYGNRIAGQSVSFSVTGGGTISEPRETVTDAAGVAVSGAWTLGSTLGRQYAIAESPGSRIRFTAEVVDETSHLLFVRGGDIYRFDLGNGIQHRLTTNGSSFTPAWSRDGRIAFAVYDRTGAGLTSIYLMDADGSSVVRRTTDTPFHSPTWSPDGRSLAVAGGATLCVYQCSIATLAVSADENPAWIAEMGAEPAWSPDGSKIAYVRLSGDDGWHALDVVSADGIHTTEIVPQGAHAIWGVDWSPDGQQLVFASCEFAACDLFTVGADGSQLRRLTDIGSATQPAWSRNGNLIAFITRDGLMIMPSAGGTPVLVVPGSVDVAWGP